MTERMHPADLRAKLAMEFYKLYIVTNTDDPSHRAAIQEADLFLAELERTAKPEAGQEPCPCCRVITKPGFKKVHAPGCLLNPEPDPAALAAMRQISEATARAEAAEARVKELEEDERTYQGYMRAYGDALGIPVHVAPPVYHGNILAALQGAVAHLAAIAAGRKDAPPMPETPTCIMRDGFGWVDKIEAWVRQGWDAAASLRLDAARVDWLEKAVLGGIVTLSPELDGGAGAILDRLGDSPVYIRERNTVRDVLDAFRESCPNP